MVVHGGSSGELDFDSVASRPVCGVVEPKVCESCTRQFFRSVALPQRLREKFCLGCRAKRKRPQPAGAQ